MASWVRTITSPFRKAKACTFFNNQKEKKAREGDDRSPGMDLRGEVMACAYEDVRVMWSILDKSKPEICQVSS